MMIIYFYILTSISLTYGSDKFRTVHQWTHLNYTWRSTEEYQDALKTGRYIPENNAPTGIKLYKHLLFLSVPKFRPGIPVTLVSVSNTFTNPLLTPFPSWEMNNDSDCSNLQSVQSMEIDTKGVMWVLDGARINNYTKCPTKLVLLDLKHNGKVVHVRVFPDEVSPQQGGFLNDLVIDESDGDFAYISDASPVDPGVVVYSKAKDRAWKLRDYSMYPEKGAQQFVIKGTVLNSPSPVNGIGLSPKHDTRTLYYCAQGAYTLYSVPTSILKNYQLWKTGEWRKNITSVGKKLAQSNGIAVDSKGDMFYTVPTLYGVAKWNISTPLWTSELFDRDTDEMVWPDGFAFDQRGYIYLLSNYMYSFINPAENVIKDGRVLFRVLRYFNNAKSYLYNYKSPIGSDNIKN